MRRRALRPRKRGNIVAETSRKMFLFYNNVSPFACARNLCCGNKMLPKKIRNIFGFSNAKSLFWELYDRHPLVEVTSIFNFYLCIFVFPISHYLILLHVAVIPTQRVPSYVSDRFFRWVAITFYPSFGMFRPCSRSLPLGTFPL